MIIACIFYICKHFGPNKIFKYIFNTISLRFIIKRIIKYREGKKHMAGQFERGIKEKVQEVLDND